MYEVDLPVIVYWVLLVTVVLSISYQVVVHLL